MLALLAAILAVAGCAAHAPPSSTAGSPDSTGIAVFACVTKPTLSDVGGTELMTLADLKLREREPVDLATIVNVEAPGAAIRSTSVGGVLVFSRLKPGVYRVTSVAQDRQFLERETGSAVDYYRERAVYLFDAPTMRELAFHVDRGGLTYIGDVVIETELTAARDEDESRIRLESANDRPRVRLEPDPRHEADVWRTLLRWYRGTPWEPRIQGRIQALAEPSP